MTKKSSNETTTKTESVVEEAPDTMSRLAKHEAALAAARSEATGHTSKKRIWGAEPVYGMVYKAQTDIEETPSGVVAQGMDKESRERNMRGRNK